MIAPGYRPRISDDDAEALGLNSITELDWLVLLTITKNPARVTANRLLAYNRRTGVARQVVQLGAGYPVAQLVRLPTELATPSERLTSKRRWAMLVLTRKIGDGLLIGEGITVTILSVEGDRVKVGIDAPREVRVLRRELADAVKAQEPGRRSKYDK